MLSVMGSQINILALASGTADYNTQNSTLKFSSSEWRHKRRAILRWGTNDTNYHKLSINFTTIFYL